MVAVDPSEPGEWFEPAYLDQHRAGNARVSLGEGDVKTQDFRVSRWVCGSPLAAREKSSSRRLRPDDNQRQ